MPRARPASLDAERPMGWRETGVKPHSWRQVQSWEGAGANDSDPPMEMGWRAEKAVRRLNPEGW